MSESASLESIMEKKLESCWEREALEKELKVEDLLIGCRSREYFQNLIQQTEGKLSETYGQSLEEPYGIKVFFLWRFDPEKVKARTQIILSHIGPGCAFSRKTIYKPKHISVIRRQFKNYRYLNPRFFLYKEKKI